MTITEEQMRETMIRALEGALTSLRGSSSCISSFAAESRPRDGAWTEFSFVDRDGTYTLRWEGRPWARAPFASPAPKETA